MRWYNEGVEFTKAIMQLYKVLIVSGKYVYKKLKNVIRPRRYDGTPLHEGILLDYYEVGSHPTHDIIKHSRENTIGDALLVYNRYEKGHGHPITMRLFLPEGGSFVDGHGYEIHYDDVVNFNQDQQLLVDFYSSGWICTDEHTNLKTGEMFHLEGQDYVLKQWHSQWVAETVCGKKIWLAGAKRNKTMVYKTLDYFLS